MSKAPTQLSKFSICRGRVRHASTIHKRRIHSFTIVDTLCMSSLLLLDKLIMTLSFTEIIGQNTNIPLPYFVGWRLSRGTVLSIWASPMGRAGVFCTMSPVAHTWNVGLCPPGTGGHFPATRNLSRNCQGGVGLHLPGLALSLQLTWLVGGPGAVSGVWTRPLHCLGGPGSP